MQRLDLSLIKFILFLNIYSHYDVWCIVTYESCYVLNIHVGLVF